MPLQRIVIQINTMALAVILPSKEDVDSRFESFLGACRHGAELARLYLADDHRLSRADGCALAALGSEVVRQSAATRRAVAMALRERVEALAPSLPGAPSAHRERAIAM